MMKTIMRVMFLQVLLVGGWGVAPAQFSGFGSASYGYHSAPLYNYETIPDQLRQGYLELHYAQPVGQGVFSAGYAGGLMVFNTFTDRNYLEHSARVGYQNAFGSMPPPPRHRATQQGDEDDEDEADPPADPDSVRTFLDLQFRVSARHDKQAYREFDNTGVALSGVLRVPMGSWYMRVMNDLDRRSYTNLEELSNVTEHAIIQWGCIQKNGLSYGIALAGGMKFYTSDRFDTTIYTSPAVNPGKGNGNGNGSGKGKSGTAGNKQILTNAATTTAWQVAAGIFAGTVWKQGGASFEGWYRLNPGEGPRYLAQYVNSTMLDEDIYNDYFSYEGPEARLTAQQSLPIGVQVNVTGGIAARQFAGQALDLGGTETGPKRKDINSFAEVGLSRFIPLTDGVGLELGIVTAVSRNQSNDAYNDFSSWQVAASVGIGFTSQP